VTGGLVGRELPLARLRGHLDRAATGQRGLVLVAGEAGIGKSVLVRAATDNAALHGWGTAIDDAGAPGFWPWTHALAELVRQAGPARAVELAGDDAPLLAALSPAFGTPARQGAAARDRLLLMDAASAWLDRLAADRAVVVVLDDLQWADDSSWALLELVARSSSRAGVLVVGCYRDDELGRDARARLSRLSSIADTINVTALDRDAVAALLRETVGPIDDVRVDAVFRRAGGHPVFSRELALLGADDAIPEAVRDAIVQRVRRLPAITQQVLQVAAIAGNELLPDVLGHALGLTTLAVQEAIVPATRAGILVGDRFAHDLYREALDGEVPPPERPGLHLAIANALERRAARTAEVTPAELAGHFTAAIDLDGCVRAARWALAAAGRDRQALAFGEAAGHLRRWRAAVATAAQDPDDDLLVEVLLAEADTLARGGAVLDARGLLRAAHDICCRAGLIRRRGEVALAVTHLGAQFGARRDDVVRELESALEAALQAASQAPSGTAPDLEARLTAALARELQHSVAEDRPRALPLSERALELGQLAADPVTLLECLLARHDALWTPGSAGERVPVAEEIVRHAQLLGDDERRAEGLLLQANALLESGSAAFAPVLESCLTLLGSLGQPRHRYLVLTRRACLALLRGQLVEAEELIERAAELGTRIREPDTENVRMSQRLELVRARGLPDELRAFARAAIAHWTGAPVHAHAVAAGFLASTGELDAARHEVATVRALGSWSADRSYLWSVLIRELSTAAVALGDRELMAELLAQVAPLAGSCAVNGAVVAFAGSHAATAAMLATALGGDGSGYPEQATAVYTRLGAAGWLARLSAVPARELRRKGHGWEVRFDGAAAVVPHTKGMSDLAVLLSRPDHEVHVLELFGSDDRSAPAGELADASARAAYRRRLDELGGEPSAESEALLVELRRTSFGGKGRAFPNYPAERARKAVTGRLRDTIRKLAVDLPALSTHLDRTVVTGVHCRYQSEPGVTWTVIR
jgi:hypothetical protein